MPSAVAMKPLSSESFTSRQGAVAFSR